MAMRDPDYAVGWALDATSGETAGTDPIADAVIGAVAGGRASALRAAAISLLCWRCWASKSSSSKLLAKHESQHPPRCGPSWPRPQVVKKHICWRVAIIVEQHAPQQMARQLPWSSRVFILLRQRKQRRRRPGPVSNNRESIMSPISPGALASPFTMPATPASVAMSSIQLGLRPPTPASIRASSRTASPVPFARRAPSLSPSDPFASSASSTSGLPYDEQTVSSSAPPPASHEPSMRSHSPAPALVLHEAPPAYDNSSRPPSLLLRGDRKM